MASSRALKNWKPTRFTIGGSDHDLSNAIVVIISNQPLKNPSLLIAICKRALFIVCADGGANRLKDLDLKDDEEAGCRPNMICGDLDSIRPEVLQYYEKKGVKICKNEDKYSTDLQKCLEFMSESNEFAAIRGRCLPSPSELQDQQIQLAIFGGLGGRADQAFSQVHHLYTLAGQHSDRFNGDFYLITTESLMFLLQKGLNKIYIPVQRHYFTENIGIIPIGRPAIITTHGLEWDVTDWPTEFGTQISTSNHIKAAVVAVECTERVLFTLEFDDNCKD